ncbi:DUF309 domain-containing protein [bacterium]|nr:DUF309 domain-containing protein [bacterium]
MGFFECFNRELFFEAHEVLEELWLANRQGPNYSFYKGLIQLAGAFVHLQKDRLKPAVALFNLADRNIGGYAENHEGVCVRELLNLIADWRGRIVDFDFKINPLENAPAPKLDLPGMESTNSRA